MTRRRRDARRRNWLVKKHRIWSYRNEDRWVDGVIIPGEEFTVWAMRPIRRKKP